MSIYTEQGFGTPSSGSKWTPSWIPSEVLSRVYKLHQIDVTNAGCREKRRRRGVFDLSQSVHESEYPQLKRPPEPDHRFEVNLEAASYSDEK